MNNGKDLTTAERQKITMLLQEVMSTLDVSMVLRVSSNIRKSAENINKLRLQSKGKDFKNLLPRDEYKLK